MRGSGLEGLPSGKSLAGGPRALVTAVAQSYRTISVSSRNAVTGRVFAEYLRLEQSVGKGLDSWLGREDEGSFGNASGPGESDDDSLLAN